MKEKPGQKRISRREAKRIACRLASIAEYRAAERVVELAKIQLAEIVIMELY